MSVYRLLSIGIFFRVGGPIAKCHSVKKFGKKTKAGTLLKWFFKILIIF